MKHFPHCSSQLKDMSDRGPCDCGPAPACAVCSNPEHAYNHHSADAKHDCYNNQCHPFVFSPGKKSTLKQLEAEADRTHKAFLVASLKYRAELKRLIALFTDMPKPDRSDAACAKHPKYTVRTAKRPPRADCLPCRLIWRAVVAKQNQVRLTANCEDGAHKDCSGRGSDPDLSCECRCHRKGKK